MYHRNQNLKILSRIFIDRISNYRELYKKKNEVDIFIGERKLNSVELIANRILQKTKN